jgi:glycosyltransferase involved in cell wall biosynthesis
MHNRVMFIYWGRRGISKLVLDLAAIAKDRAVFSVSAQNELFEQIRATGAPLVPIQTFAHPAGALTRLSRVIGIRRRLLQAIEHYRVKRLVVLMSHVWTPLIGASLRRKGVGYTVVVHDAVPHPGDITSIVNRWLMQDAIWADEIVTLSRHVAIELTRRFPFLTGRLRVLFLPTGTTKLPIRTHSHPLIGFLFLGRLIAYKGLPIFVEACEILRGRGFSFRIGVAGEGALGKMHSRLEALGAEITNRWIPHQELETLVASYDVVVAANTEASQSGVIALAYSCGLPVIATPVGGMVEQIEDGRSGLLARNASAAAIADSMQLFLIGTDLRGRLRIGVREMNEKFSMDRFFQAIAAGSLGNAEVDTSAFFETSSQ